MTIPIYLQLLFDKKPITCNRFINFLSDRDITFVRAVSQNRVDEYSGMKLRQISLDVPSVVKLRGVDRKLYAYRIGEDTDKEKVVISNKGLSKRRFEGYYSCGDSKMFYGCVACGVRKDKSHAEWYAPFPDDNLVFFWLSRFIKGGSCHAKL